MSVNDVKKRIGHFYSQAIQHGSSHEEFMNFMESVMTIYVTAKKEYKEREHEGESK